MQLRDYPGTRAELLPTLLQPANFNKAQASINGCKSTASAGPGTAPPPVAWTPWQTSTRSALSSSAVLMLWVRNFILFAYVAVTSDKCDEPGFYVHTDLYAASALCHSWRTSGGRPLSVPSSACAYAAYRPCYLQCTYCR